MNFFQRAKWYNRWCTHNITINHPQRESYVRYLKTNTWSYEEMIQQKVLVSCKTSSTNLWNKCIQLKIQKKTGFSSSEMSRKSTYWTLLLNWPWQEYGSQYRVRITLPSPWSPAKDECMFRIWCVLVRCFCSGLIKVQITQWDMMTL